jgi:hypothetical protein
LASFRKQEINGEGLLYFCFKINFMVLLEIGFQEIEIGVLILFFISIAWMLAEFRSMKDEIRKRIDIRNETLKLRLQAYERLTVFADRASLRNLVSRTPYGGANVVDVQLALLETLRTEYEYNVSQQIYVSPEMWKAVTNLKDQNAYIINQIAGLLPSQAAGVELAKRILEYSSTKNAELNTIVLDALQFEAKKVL